MHFTNLAATQKLTLENECNSSTYINRQLYIQLIPAELAETLPGTGLKSELKLQTSTSESTKGKRLEGIIFNEYAEKNVDKIWENNDYS